LEQVIGIATPEEHLEHLGVH